MEALQPVDDRCGPVGASWDNAKAGLGERVPAGREGSSGPAGPRATTEHPALSQIQLLPPESAQSHPVMEDLHLSRFIYSDGLHIEQR